MEEWWSSLIGVQQLLWGLAIPFTILFVLQMGAALFGLSDHGDSDGAGGDMSGASLSIFDYFTLRSAVVFFLGFSWGGLACIDSGISVFWGVLIGLIMVALNLLLLRGLASFNESGNLNLENAVGTNAVVSIRIPEKLSGCGKVNISFQRRLEELEAMTEGKEEIPRGKMVKVVRIFNNQLIVSILNEL
jgi:hypothetical protein